MNLFTYRIRLRDLAFYGCDLLAVDIDFGGCGVLAGCVGGNLYFKIVIKPDNAIVGIVES